LIKNCGSGFSRDRTSRVTLFSVCGSGFSRDGTSRVTLFSVCGSGFSRDRTSRLTLFSVCGSGFSRDRTSRLTLFSVCGSGFSRERTSRLTLFSVCGSGFSRDAFRTGSQLASFFSGMARFAALYFRKKRSYPLPSRTSQNRQASGLCDVCRACGRDVLSNEVKRTAGSHERDNHRVRSAV